MGAYFKWKVFIKEQDINIKNILYDLMKLRLTLDIKYKEHIKGFFENIQNTSDEFNNNKLSDIGKRYEDYIRDIDSIEECSDSFFSNILKGISEIKTEIDILKEKYNKSEQNENNTTVKVDDRECTKTRGEILVLDDDRFMLSILQDAFESRGYKVIAITNPYEAIEMILNRNINLALIDIVMPKLNGFEVFEILKKNNIDVPVIFLTGKLVTEYKVDALRKGVDDYITKPFDINEVIARAERAIIRSKVYKSKLTTDRLTGIYNKGFFIEKIIEYKNSLDMSEQSISVAFMDIDDFKIINDTYGHVVGDYILKDYANFMKSYIDEQDLLFRFGGDEFLILFYGKDEQYAFKQMESIRKGLNEVYFKYDCIEDKIKLSISAGITYVAQEDDIEEILDRADKCLYKSKELGKNRTVCFTGAKNNKALGKKILILKNESKKTSDIEIRLKYIGYEVYLAHDVSKLITLIEEVNPSLFIIDLKTNSDKENNMFDKLKNYDKYFKQAKLMFIVSKEENMYMSEYIKLGIDEYISKPFSIPDLEEKVNKLLKSNL